MKFHKETAHERSILFGWSQIQRAARGGGDLGDSGRAMRSGVTTAHGEGEQRWVSETPREVPQGRRRGGGRLTVPFMGGRCPAPDGCVTRGVRVLAARYRCLCLRTQAQVRSGLASSLSLSGSYCPRAGLMEGKATQSLPSLLVNVPQVE